MSLKYNKKDHIYESCWGSKKVTLILIISRYEMLQDNVEGYRKEIASLREKGQKMATATQKHEQTIHTLTADLGAAKEKLTMAEVCHRSIVLFDASFQFACGF